MSKFVRIYLVIFIFYGLFLLGKCNEEEECEEGRIYADNICLNSWDVANYEAIRTLHAQLDDDHNGDIDLSESVDFLREELNYTKEVEKRQNFFHPNNDHHISVNELWTMWLDSEVRNWTVENMVSWLCLNVDLYMYVEVFQENAVNGSVLPRLANINDHFLTRTLGIKNPAHRSKIAIKAMDVVLFGPPKDTGSYIKDITILLLITFLVIGAFRFYHVQKDFDRQRRRMMQEMEYLNLEERKFREELQLNSGGFEEEHTKSISNEVCSEANQNESTPSSMKWNLEDDTESTATNETSSPLQLWLQLSYEREKAVFDCKCQMVEAQLKEAKEMCEKLHPSKKQFFATLGLVHGKTEPKYGAIAETVRDSIAEIKLLHQEMEYRWNSIEKLTSSDITINAGLTHLEFLLEPDIHFPSKGSSSTVELDQSTKGFKSAGFRQRQRRKEFASSSETGSIRSLPVQNSCKSTTSSLHHSNTIGSALGNAVPFVVGNSTDGSLRKNHSTIGISSSNSGSKTQLLCESKKNDVNGASEVADSNPPENSILPQVRSRVKPFIKSYSQDAVEEWPRIVGGKNDSKFKSEPTLESDGNAVSETVEEPFVNGTELRRSKRRSKFFPSKILEFKMKLKAKTEKVSKIKQNA